MMLFYDFVSYLFILTLHCRCENMHIVFTYFGFIVSNWILLVKIIFGIKQKNCLKRRASCKKLQVRAKSSQIHRIVTGAANRVLDIFCPQKVSAKRTKPRRRMAPQLGSYVLKRPKSLILSGFRA